MKRYIHILLCVIVTGILQFGNAFASEIQVVNEDNSGPGSLRDAILNAAVDDIITFSQDVKNIVLDSEIQIFVPLTIDGTNGTDEGVIIQVPDPGNSPYRLFMAEAIGQGTIYLKNLTLKGGKLAINNNINNPVINEGGEIENLYNGGAIYINDKEISLELDHVKAIGSVAVNGGAIYTKGDIVLMNSTFEKNEVHFTGIPLEIYVYNGGGAIRAWGDMHIKEGCSFISNKVQTYSHGYTACGGAVFVDGLLSIEGDSTNRILFKGNTGKSTGSMRAYGGAVFGKNTTTIYGAEFSENIANEYPNNGAHGYGGGIHTEGDLRVEDSFFQGNYAHYAGGGIHSVGETIHIINSRFEYNNTFIFGAYGGAIATTNNGSGKETITYADGTKLTVTKCIFGDENISEDYSNLAANGGAIGMISKKSRLLVEDSEFYKNKANYNGGAIYTLPFHPDASNDPTVIVNINNCNFYDNYSFNDNPISPQNPSFGGVLYMESSQSILNIEGECMFTGNKSHGGSAIMLFYGNYIANIGTKPGSKINFLDNGTLAENNDMYKDTGSGGAIELFNCYPIEMSEINIGSYDSEVSFIGNNSFKGTYAHGDGGALSLRRLEAAINLVNILFKDNKGENGGAIFSFSEISQLGCPFLENKSVQHGGAIYLNAPGSLTNLLIAGNQALMDGGGIYCRESDPVMTNVTLADNTAAYGGAVSVYSSNPTVRNSIIWRNTSSEDDEPIDTRNGGTFTYQYSLIDGDSGNFTATAENGNLDGALPENNPQFNKDQLPAESNLDDYDLAIGSPAINAGNNSYYPASLPQKDITGTRNRFLSRIDMGAYESNYAGPTAQFEGDGEAVCEGSTGSLKVKLSGDGPWILGFKSENATNETTVKIAPNEVKEGLYTLKGIRPGKYTLTSVQEGTEGNEINGTITGLSKGGFSSVSKPFVADIVGESEVNVGETIRLTNQTTGGQWHSNDDQCATVDQSGNVHGLKTGTVNIWYIVTGSAPTYCEAISTHTITVKSKENPNPEPGPEPEPEPEPNPEDPDPEWPVVVPEPDPEPDPDPDAWIIIRPGTVACYSDEFFNLSFRLQYTSKSLKYAVAFTEVSKAVGFQEVKNYLELPADGIVSITIPRNVEPGQYAGYLLVRETGSTEYQMYPFTFTVNEEVAITRQPESVTLKGDGENVRLSVEARGNNLRYQWFYNGQRIENADAQTYETIYDGSKEGLYYVEVYSDCGWKQSEEVTVTGCFNILIKWDDVLYVKNTESHYVRFQWYRNGEVITHDGTSIYYTNPEGLQGSYFVRAYRTDGTYDQSCAVTFDTVTRSSIVNIYPTHVERSHYMNVESDERGDSYVGGTVELYNLSGGKVYAQRLHSPKSEIAMNIPTGVYIVVVTSSDGKQRKTEKVIVR